MTERSETQALIEEARAFIEENHDGGGDEGVFALLGRLVDALAASEARGERLAEAVTAFGALADAFDGDVPRLGGWSQPVDDDYEVKVTCTVGVLRNCRAQAALGKTEKEGKP